MLDPGETRQVVLRIQRPRRGSITVLSADPAQPSVEVQLIPGGSGGAAGPG